MHKRIISLAPSNTEILFALGAGDKVVGCTKYCDYPSLTQAVPKIGSWINAYDFEQFYKLKADLILTSMFVPPEVKEWAQKAEVRLVNLNPRSVDEIYQGITGIGKLVGKEKEAGTLIADMKEQARKLQAKTLPGRPRIYSEEYHKPPTIGANWVPELIEAVGGIAMGKGGVLSTPIPPEDVKTWDPDMFILHWCGAGEKSDPRQVLQRHGWEEIRAVKTCNIFVVDDNLLNRPGPRIWEGAQKVYDILETYLSE